MDSIIQIIKSDNFLISTVIINIFLLLLVIINFIKTAKLNKKYEIFIKKIGNGKNIEEDLSTYMKKVIDVEEENKQIKKYCKNLKEQVEGCTQKIGIVRYSAFKDTGSDLSFALAMLDEKNDGVILNGIYSREMSNIYAKPIKNGQSQYTLSQEEQDAINKAIKTELIMK